MTKILNLTLRLPNYASFANLQVSWRVQLDDFFQSVRQECAKELCDRDPLSLIKNCIEIWETVTRNRKYVPNLKCMWIVELEENLANITLTALNLNGAIFRDWSVNGH